MFTVDASLHTRKYTLSFSLYTTFPSVHPSFARDRHTIMRSCCAAEKRAGPDDTSVCHSSWSGRYSDGALGPPPCLTPNMTLTPSPPSTLSPPTLANHPIKSVAPPPGATAFRCEGYGNGLPHLHALSSNALYATEGPCER
ncbi:unnamed protein product [Caenorhabditis auriculariae]|uniref:Uncharacterized protein n=1 Tax=Caenorhabditis auriculariae TaxID=2777116 RepID=A0A8S1GRI3_9PELO|nr:unnamed protein product [Caenorhabditis auriculariae]